MRATMVLREKRLTQPAMQRVNAGRASSTHLTTPLFFSFHFYSLTGLPLTGDSGSCQHLMVGGPSLIHSPIVANRTKARQGKGSTEAWNDDHHQHHKLIVIPVITAIQKERRVYCVVHRIFGQTSLLHHLQHKLFDTRQTVASRTPSHRIASH